MTNKYPSSDKINVLCIYPVGFSDRGVSHACLSVISGMCSSKLNASVIGISSKSSFSSPYYHDAIPSLINLAAYKLFKEKDLRRFCEFRFLRKLNNNDLVYLWPATSIGLFEEIKSRGNKLIVENINCHQNVSKRLLDEEYAKLGVKPSRNITQKDIEDEAYKLQLADYVFSPSPMVTDSLITSGVNNEKILQTSYGLSENELFDFRRKTNKNKPLTAIFVGRVGVRKGIHLLLKYWVKANINGVLKIVGEIENTASKLVEPFLNHPKIQFTRYTNNLSEIYSNADFFILPSLEEGSPLVTYLALGAGLPCLVSPMGGGGIINHGVEGFVINPHDEDEWITSIIKLAENPDLRELQSSSARNTAETYLWKNVGQRRSRILIDKLEN